MLKKTERLRNGSPCRVLKCPSGYPSGNPSSRKLLKASQKSVISMRCFLTKKSSYIPFLSLIIPTHLQLVCDRLRSLFRASYSWKFVFQNVHSQVTFVKKTRIPHFISLNFYYFVNISFLCLHILDYSGHPFRLIPAGNSEAVRPLVQVNPATL